VRVTGEGGRERRRGGGGEWEERVSEVEGGGVFGASSPYCRR
jgi:hypothetical protein